jgi:hypothetical protein
MKKINTYTFNIYRFLIFMSLIGCGNTLSNSGNKLEVLNGNSTSVVTKEFKLIKLQKTADFDKLPKEFERYKNEITQFDFYLVQSPTQNSGGYIFQLVQNSNPLVICLKKPDPLASVTAALTNPIALVKVKQGTVMELSLGYCAS